LNEHRRFGRKVLLREGIFATSDASHFESIAQQRVENRAWLVAIFDPQY